MPDPATLALLVILALIVGGLVGCVGIGGVLLPPALAYIGGFDLHLAMATSMFSFLFTGIAGTATYWRRSSIDWRLVAWLSAGIVPAALLGARSNGALPVSTLTVLLALLIVAAGVNAFTKPPAGDRSPSGFGALVLVPIGVIVGFGSALTGTGGPVLLVPLLVFLRMPVLSAVGAIQPIQLPVAAFATIGYFLYGRVDFTLGAVLGLVAVAGVVMGARIAHAVPARTLRLVVALALVGVGLSMLIRNLGEFV